MEFEDIRIEQVNKEKAEQADDNNIRIPYLISAVPPKEWVLFFWNSIEASEREARNQSDLPSNIQLFDKQITFICRQKEENLEKIRKGGYFWKFFERSIEYANKEYRKSENERLRTEAKEKQEQERKREVFDEFIKKI